MNITNKTVMISGPSRTVQRGTLTVTVTESDWERYIVPLVYPLWDSDKDVLMSFTYRDLPEEQFFCEKKKYVRNHTTGEYFWKDYIFSEVDLEVARKLATDISEAVDAIASTTKRDVDEMFNTIMKREKGLSLARIKAWRNFFLFSSDWTMLEDAPISAEEKEQWKLYRQKIRALPDLFDAGTSVLAEVHIPIDPIVYRKNYLPYNDGATYLGSDDQFIWFPGKDGLPGGALDRAMHEYMHLAIKMSRPSPMFNVPNVSHLTDPIDALVAEIEREQALLDELRAQQNAASSD